MTQHGLRRSAKSPGVRPSELLGRALTPDGTDMTLLRRGNEYVILADGKALMSSRMHGSEEALATFGCDRARRLDEPCVLVGGLGMGFSLRATLDLLPRGATVVVAELLPAIVEWNQAFLGELAGHPLRDRRVRVEIGDVAATLRERARTASTRCSSTSTTAQLPSPRRATAPSTRRRARERARCPPGARSLRGLVRAGRREVPAPAAL